MPLQPSRIMLLLSLVLAGLPAGLTRAETSFGADDIDAAQYEGGDLPAGRSAITAKVQVLLDRSGISPGVVDGYRGGMSESAISAFERMSGLPIDGRMDPEVWQLLQPFAASPVTMDYQITLADAEGLVDRIPADYGEKAKMSSQGYTSILEKLAERFHMDEKFITYLNPGVPIEPGSTIRVTTPAKPIRTRVTRILVDKATRRVAAYDAAGNLIVDYPATIGSDDTPSPSGTHKVVTVALNPNYTYNPDRNFRQGNNDKPLVIPPGPNGPVGTVWIDLSQPTYGIHGTPTPSRLFHNQSHGCVRLTNWDAEELAHMVIPGVTSVEFLAPGVTIAEAVRQGLEPVADLSPAPTDAAAKVISARAPLPRPSRRPQTADPIAPGDIVPATVTSSEPRPAAGLGWPQAATGEAVRPLRLPDTGMAGALPGAAGAANPTEAGSPAPADDRPADLLSDALSGALPDADVRMPGSQP